MDWKRHRLLFGHRQSCFNHDEWADQGDSQLYTERSSGNGADESRFGKAFDMLVETRRQEADEFYQSVIPASVGEDGANVMSGVQPPDPLRQQGRLAGARFARDEAVSGVGGR